MKIALLINNPSAWLATLRRNRDFFHTPIDAHGLRRRYHPNAFVLSENRAGRDWRERKRSHERHRDRRAIAGAMARRAHLTTPTVIAPQLKRRFVPGIS